MRYFFCLILCLLFVPKLQAAQMYVKDISQLEIESSIKEHANELVISDDPINLDSELAIALADLEKIPPQERSSMKYFTLYTAAHDAKLLQNLYLELIFWTNSLSMEGFFSIPQPVEGSATLFRVDIRDYGWTEQGWEKMSVIEPYIKEPWINYELITEGRYQSGNLLVRADWFIDATSSPNKQILNGIEEILYYTLLYSKTGTPQNRDEYYKIWGIDKDKIENKVKTVKQILIGDEDSGVAHHNRGLARTGIELGYHYESSDFLTSTGKQNVLNNLAPGKLAHPERDAGEYITRMNNGLQAYFITNKADQKVDVVNTDIAEDNTAKKSAVQYRSCVTCHAQGINSAINGVKNILELNVNLYTANKEKYLDMKRTYGRDMEADMARDVELYNEAVQKCNGLTAKENAVAFQQVLDFYNAKLTTDQCARECGVTVERFVQAASQSTSATLLRVARGDTITRAQWEKDDFAVAMLLLKGLPEPPKPAEVKAEVTAPVVPEERVLYVRVTKDSPLMSGKNTRMVVKAGESYPVIAQQDLWYKVEIDGVAGWLHRQDLAEEYK